MRLRNVPGAIEILSQTTNFVSDPMQNKGYWRQYFGNSNTIHLEIGSGKGRFITQLAEQNPDINYIAMEKFSTVSLKLIQKIPEKGFPNLVLLHQDAKDLTEIFHKGELHRLYLNFSDPWPKDRHFKRRLTYKDFLDKYKHILTPEGEIHFKTDNKELFEFSLEQFTENQWTLKTVTQDLHNSKFAAQNIMTEYEMRFSSKGHPIYMLIAKTN